MVRLNTIATYRMDDVAMREITIKTPSCHLSVGAPEALPLEGAGADEPKPEAEGAAASSAGATRQRKGKKQEDKKEESTDLKKKDK